MRASRSITLAGTGVRFLAAALGASLFLSACGGSSDNGTVTAAPSPSVAATQALAPSPTGDECTADTPANLRSTSHQVGVATTKQTIEMVWDALERPAGSYRYAFSQDPEEPPAQMETLAGDATTARSGLQGQNSWYFYLVVVTDGSESDPVRCGPYVITRSADGNPGGGGGGAGDSVRLTISVQGGSSVEYFTNRNERLFCGDTTKSLHEVTCTAEFVRGSEARIQRTLGLPNDEEVRWRLAGWEGACEGLEADVEPRGGQCILSMDDDKDVLVTFERRATITITHAGPPELLLRWEVDYRPADQKGGGNALTLRGTFDCNTNLLANCTKTGYFDTGTTVILKAGIGVNAGNFSGFGGACTTTQSTCELQLESDAEVTYMWQY